MWSRHPEIVFAPYLNGELDAEESRRLQEHVEGCARCSEGLAEAKSAMDRLAREIDQIAEPDWVVYRAELHRKLNARRYRAPARRWTPRWAWASVATAAAATAGCRAASARRWVGRCRYRSVAGLPGRRASRPVGKLRRDREPRLAHTCRTAAAS